MEKLELSVIEEFEVLSAARKELERLIVCIRDRLGDGFVLLKDNDGDNVTTFIYKQRQIVSAIYASLMDVNQLFSGKFENQFSLNDRKTLKFLSSILVQGAVVKLLGAKALVEKGKEGVYKDSGVFIQSPNCSSMIYDQYIFEYQNYWNKLDNRDNIVVDSIYDFLVENE